MHRLTATQARRIAVQAQLLSRDRPTDLADVVRHLAVIQNDLTRAVAPNADIVLWSRLGSAYRPADLIEALRDGTLIELAGLIRPAEDIALFRAEMADWPGSLDTHPWRETAAEWVEINDLFRRDILARLEAEGPLTSQEIPDDACNVAWRSSGWNNRRNSRIMLGLLEQMGEVALAGYQGRDRLWDLADRVYPDDPAVPADEAIRIRNERRLRSLGLARARTQETPTEPNDVSYVGERAVIDGVSGHWQLDPSYLDQPFRGRTAILSPLDRLVFDRKRMEELFGFDYQLEMYKPAAKRRWGYWAMPILSGDRLIGKVDATSDRKAGVLRVAAIHQDAPFTPTTSNAVARELTDLARCLDLDLSLPS